MRKTAQALIVAVALTSLPSTATACGMCMFGVVEYTLPHTMFWCLCVTIWFCALGSITAPKGKKAHRFVTDFSVVFVMYIVSTAFLGPFPFGLLAFIACIRTISGFLPNIRKTMSEKSKRCLNVVTAAVFVCIPAALAASAHTLNTRTDADFVLQWENTYAGRYRLQQLIAEEDKIQLRQILAQTKDEDMAKEVTLALATLEEERAADHTQTNPPKEQGENDTERKTL